MVNGKPYMAYIRILWEWEEWEGYAIFIELDRFCDDIVQFGLTKMELSALSFVAVWDNRILRLYGSLGIARH